jgi:hypothetical protein
MLIECKIEFKNGVLTISQHIEPGGANHVTTPRPTTAVSVPEVKPNVEAQTTETTPQIPQAQMSVDELPQHFRVANETPSESTPAAKAAEGGQAHDSASTGGGAHDTAGTGGGPHDPAGTGGGGPGSGSVVIIIGPIVMAPTGRTGPGGGGHDDAGPG